MRLHYFSEVDVPTAIDWLNGYGISKFFVQFIQKGKHREGLYIVLRTEDYRSYCWMCENLGLVAMSLEEYLDKPKSFVKLD